MPLPWKSGEVRGPNTANGGLRSRTSPLSHRRWDNRCAIAPIAPSPGDDDLKFL